jgi:hypothetical protein
MGTRHHQWGAQFNADVKSIGIPLSNTISSQMNENTCDMMVGAKEMADNVEDRNVIIEMNEDAVENSMDAVERIGSVMVRSRYRGDEPRSRRHAVRFLQATNCQ